MHPTPSPLTAVAGDAAVLYPFPRVSHSELQSAIRDAASCAKLMGRDALVYQSSTLYGGSGKLSVFSKACEWGPSNEFSRRLATVSVDGLVRYEKVRL